MLNILYIQDLSPERMKLNYYKNIIFIVVLLLVASSRVSAQYDSENISIYSNWKDSNLTHDSLEKNYNSVWGYHDSIKNREYAILGGKNGTYFIDVTNPFTPVLADYVPGKRGDCIWREYKNYGKYIYLISDDSPPNSLQIADMSYLPDSVHLIHDSDSILVAAHTLFINEDKLYCADVKSSFNNYSSMSVYNLDNPEKPFLIKRLDQDDPDITTIHDMYIRNDTVYASAGFQGLHVYHLLSDNTLNKLGSVTSYPDIGYNHSSWLTENGKTMVFCDEVPNNLAVKVIDVSDLSDIKVLSLFKSNEGATPHNPYIIGNERVVISYYEDGVQIYDISNPLNPVKTGFFDTHFQNNGTYDSQNAYNGCWGAYPYLPSGILLASDRQNGLFVLDAKNALNASKSKSSKNLKIFPNPFLDKLEIQFPEAKGSYKIYFFDLSGRTIYFKNILLQHSNNYEIMFEKEIPAGIYFLHIVGEVVTKTEKVVKF